MSNMLGPDFDLNFGEARKQHFFDYSRESSKILPMGALRCFVLDISLLVGLIQETNYLYGKLIQWKEDHVINRLLLSQ